MTKDKHNKVVIDVLSKSEWHMRTLDAAHELDLPDWAIGAGFVRNAVWDHLHGFDNMTPLTDVDVLYFDKSDPRTEHEVEIEKLLSFVLPDRP